ncbi:MAG: sigma-70 family RNA polymerase sigma factor [Planctomycetes bacterium]|nr:sigma-70 family RNA polymerase sigma factor [Planctomycetota bacterium]MCB9934650.1 sigma-70 family RNA polymerase sigma factor [Planctomycetota bacterium]
MTQGSPEIQHLLPALKAGSTEAYRELVRSMGEPLSRYALRIVTDPGTAQDVVQEAFLRIYRHRKRLDERLELRGLCFRTVRNLARNHVRNASLRKRREQEADDMRGGDDSGQASLAREAWELVKHLPATLREVVELRFSFGLSRAEIAATLEIPEGTVATRQRTALETLREQISTRSVAPAVALPGLAELLALPQPSSPTPNLFQMEELVMNGIRSIRIKAAGMAASLALAALLLCIGGVATVSALSKAGGAAPQQVAHTNERTADGTSAPGRTASAPVAMNPNQQPTSLPKQAPLPAPTPATAPTGTGTAEPAVQPGKESPVAPKAAPHQPEQPVAAAANAAPQFLSQPVLVACVGYEYSYLVEVSGNPQPHLTATGLPAWLRLDGALLHGVAGAADAHSRISVTLDADNGVAPSARQQFLVLVQSAPEFTSTPSADAAAGEQYSYQVTLKGEPKPSLRMDNGPAWLSLSGETLSGTPSRGDTGDVKVKLVATNGVQPDAEQGWTLTVKCPPQFDSQPVEKVTVGRLYEYEIKVSGSPAPALDASKLPGWLKLEGGKLTGKPRRDDIGKSKKITLTADNGLKPKATQSFKIEVEDDPKYLEVPWTLEEMKAYVHVGMKYTTKDSHTMIDDMTITTPGEVRDYTVTKVGDKGFTVEWEEATSRVNGKVVKSQHMEREISWDEALTVPVWPDAKDIVRSEESMEIAGKRIKCVVYTFKTSFEGGAKAVDWTHSFYYAKEYPFMAVLTTLTTPSPSIGMTDIDRTVLSEVKKAK